MNVIEIQTIEGGRLDWVAIASAKASELIRFGDAIKYARYPHNWPSPNLRLVENGKVTGAWQADGYEAVDD